jgi:hypothetical protein
MTALGARRLNRQRSRILCWVRLLHFHTLSMLAQRSALPVIATIDDEIGRRELNVRVALPAPYRHVADVPILLLDLARAHEVVVIRKNRKGRRLLEGVAIQVTILSNGHLLEQHLTFGLPEFAGVCRN